MDGARLSQQQDGATYSLVLRDVTQHDAGVYTCLARNAGGQVLCKAELVVHGGELGVPSRSPVSATRGHRVGGWPLTGSSTRGDGHLYQNQRLPAP